MREVDRRSKYDRRVFLKGAATAVPTVAIASSSRSAAVPDSVLTWKPPRLISTRPSFVRRCSNGSLDRRPR